MVCGIIAFIFIHSLLSLLFIFVLSILHVQVKILKYNTAAGLQEILLWQAEKEILLFKRDRVVHTH